MNRRTIVVGAGVAGLAAAATLSQAGQKPLVIEASTSPGGRVRSDTEDGFIFDRGFQVLLTSYPTARALLNLEKLRLASFSPGARIRWHDNFYDFVDPLRDPKSLFAMLTSPLVGLRDKIGVSRLRVALRSLSREQIFLRPPMTTFSYLRQAGFSEEIIERFFRPFFAGVFLERELGTSSQKFEYLFSMFAKGLATLPREGIEAIPRQMAATLPEGSIRCGSPAVKIEDDYLILEDGQRIQAHAVILASIEAERQLLPEKAPPTSFHCTFCSYFSPPQLPPPLQSPLLLLNGSRRGLITNIAPLSAVQPSYSSTGRPLISVNVAGPTTTSEAQIMTSIRKELREWFGEETDEWVHLRSYMIQRALPAMPPGHSMPSPILGERLFRCGDHVGGGSLEGALRSGVVAANLALRE